MQDDDGEVICQLQSKSLRTGIFPTRTHIAATNSPIKVVNEHLFLDDGQKMRRVILEMPDKEWEYFSKRVTPILPDGAWFTVICNCKGKPWYRVRIRTENCHNEEIGCGNCRESAAKEAWEWSKKRFKAHLDTGEISEV